MVGAKQEQKYIISLHIFKKIDGLTLYGKSVFVLI